MAETAFTWFPKLTKVLKALPAENVAEFALALTCYGTDGIEPEFTSPLLAAVFEGVRDDIDNSVSARTKNKGGRPKTQNRRENGGFDVCETQETPVSEFQATPEPPLCEVSESENPSYIYQTKPNHTKLSQTKPEIEGTRAPAPDPDAVFEQCESDPDGSAFAAFVADCMAAFNEVTGKDIRGASPKVQLRLRRIYDNGRTVDDVRRVVAGKAAQWRDDPRERRFITPETLFGDSFESYLNETICAEVEDPEKPRCPACGGALDPITAHDPKAKPGDFWCPGCGKKVYRGFEVRP